MFLSRILWLAIVLVFVAASVPAQEIEDMYCDIQSCDVTVAGNVDGAVLEADLIFGDAVLDTERLLLDGPGMWVVRWDRSAFEEGPYTGCARLIEGNEILSERCFDFHYGSRVPLRFDVRDFYADQKGIRLLLEARDLAVVDIYYMLLEQGKVLRVAKDESVPISGGAAPTYIEKEWKLLLENNVDYWGRVKIVEKRNNQTRVFMNSFVAKDDAEITDTYEDETGASATVVGTSRVPFEGSLRFVLSQNGTVVEIVEKATPILLVDDDETVEISWNDTLDPGLYQLSIILLGNDGDEIDFEESVIEAETPPNPTAVVIEDEDGSTTYQYLGIAGLIAAVSILIYWWRRRG